MPFFLFRLLTLHLEVAAWFVVVTHAISAAETTKSARAVLHQAGLREAHHRWICRDEARLLRLLDRVDVIEDEWRRANRTWRSLGDEQQRLRARIKESNKTIERLDGEIAASTSDALRNQRQKTQQANLRRRLAQDRRALHRRLDGLNERSEFTQAARRLANLHIETEAHRFALEENSSVWNTWYRAMDDRTRRALSALNAETGVEARLGPVKDYSHLIDLNLDRLQTVVGAASVPIYREGGRFQVPVVFNEAVPVTMGVEDEIDISIGPASLFAQAGVDVEGGQLRREVTVGDHRAVGLVVRVARLRVGSIVFRNVEFLAVDAGGEGDGPLLATSLFDDQRIIWDDKRLEFRRTQQ